MAEEKAASFVIERVAALAALLPTSQRKKNNIARRRLLTLGVG